MIADGDRVFAHRFDGYWRDVGTIQSYFRLQHGAAGGQAGDRPGRPRVAHPHQVRGAPAGYVGADAVVRQSMISHGCRIDGTVERSVLSPGVIVETGAVVRARS